MRRVRVVARGAGATPKQTGQQVGEVLPAIDGRKVVTEMDRRTVIDNNESTNFGGPPPKE